ncbi:hypothetical protein Esti_000240 [Eimeria stiedai]
MRMGFLRTKEVALLLFFSLCPCWPPSVPSKVPGLLVSGRLPAEETSLHVEQRHGVSAGPWESFFTFRTVGPAGALAASPGRSDSGQIAQTSDRAQDQQNELPPEESSASAPAGNGDMRDDQAPTTFCSGGLRLAFDCALKRVIAFGVRDHLIDKYKLPMVPLDVCQGGGLMDVEQCIPEDFVDAFPSDTLLDVVRQKRLIVGTMDLSVFPQLVADQANTTGFYPELMQAIARELTVIALQSAGLRRELVGERQLNISVLEQPFSQRVRELKAAMARRWRYGEACGGKAGASVDGLQQLPVPASEPVASSGEGLAKVENQSATGLMFADASSGASACPFSVELSPWEGIPNDVFIGVAHVKFSTPMNLIAAVHRGEVHMTDVGTVASAYLPEKYNFLPLREVLEPSCSIGAWKSFFLLRDSASKGRRAHRAPPSDADQVIHEQSAHHEDRTRRPPSLFPASGSLIQDKAFWKDLSAGDDARSGRQRFGMTESSSHWDLTGASESWEDKTKQTRKLFFKLFGVEPEASSASSGQVDGTGAATGLSASRSTEEEVLPLDERTLVKLHHVDHFTYSYLFPEDFRICSVRKLTDLSSLLSDGEPIGAFGYGLAGRGGRRQTLSGSKWHCPSQQARGQRPRSSGWLRDTMMPLVSRRKSGCDGYATPRRLLRTDDGLPQVFEFPGPLVPLAAFFPKSRDPACRVNSKRPAATVVQKAETLTSAAEVKVFSCEVVFVALFLVALFFA